jgi:hypothetical protein
VLLECDAKTFAVSGGRYKEACDRHGDGADACAASTSPAYPHSWLVAEQQAASLEETAAALDQITTNVANSTKRAEEAEPLQFRPMRVPASLAMLLPMP